MGSSAALHWRAAAGRLGSGAALVAAGATLVLAWQMGWWATLCAAALVTAWIVAVDFCSVLPAAAPLGRAANRAAACEPGRLTTRVGDAGSGIAASDRAHGGELDLLPIAATAFELRMPMVRSDARRSPRRTPDR